MKSKFLGTVAAFAFVATGVAAQAQDSPRQDNKGAERAPTATQHMENKAGGAMQKEAPRAAEGERRDQTGEMQKKDEPKAAEGERRDQTGAMQRKDEPKAAEGQRREQTGAMQKKDEPKAAETDKRGTPDAKRQGQAGAGKADRSAKGEPRVNGIKISSEHATKISETLYRSERVQKTDFDVRVGVRVPEGFDIRPLPAEIVEMEPDYRGYDYFVDANDEIVFVAPDTHEIVGTIDYEGRAAAVDSPRAARPCPTED